MLDIDLKAPPFDMSMQLRKSYTENKTRYTPDTQSKQEAGPPRRKCRLNCVSDMLQGGCPRATCNLHVEGDVTTRIYEGVQNII